MSDILSSYELLKDDMVLFVQNKITLDDWLLRLLHYYFDFCNFDELDDEYLMDLIRDLHVIFGFVDYYEGLKNGTKKRVI